MKSARTLSTITVLFGIALTQNSNSATAQVRVFDCKFPQLSFVATDYDDNTPTRIGVEIGVGDKVKSYFDKVTGAWIFVEFIANGTLPSTLTTVLKDGTAWHSRHTMGIDGSILATQESGKCGSRTID
jgi:hypothetical protein